MRLWLAALFLVAVRPADKVTLAASGDLKEPFGVAFDKAGTMFIVEMGGNRVRALEAGSLRIYAGTGEKGNRGDGGPALEAQFNGPHHLAVGPDGAVYVTDTWNNRIRRIDPATRTIAPFAGTGEKGYSGDGGPAARAEFGGLYCMAFDSAGETLYLADLDNRRIRSVHLKTGIVSTLAGNGQKGVPENGADARTAPLVDPRAVAVDSKGNVYIVERSGHALRVVDRTGKIRTVAGTGKAGNSGDGGDARMATLNGPKHLCCDREDNVLIADTENHVIRKYTPKDGRIVRVAGTGKKGQAFSTSPDQLELSRPHGVFVHPSGALYISDSDNHRVLRMDP